MALLICGVGLVLSHLVIADRRIEKLNETLPPNQQFDVARMREQTWQFEKAFRRKFPGDWSLVWEIGCVIGGGVLEIVGLSLLIPHFFS